MGRSFQIRQPAGPHQRFAADAWSRVVGREVRLRVGDWTGVCVLVAATVNEDGDAATLTFEVPDDHGSELLGTVLGGTGPDAG